MATAAHRSGEVLKDTASGITHDFRRKGGIEHAEILAPKGVPGWVYDRAAMWNAVEASEERVNSRLAREAIITLPRELSREQRLRLVRGFVREQFVARGMVADVAIHNPKAADHLDQPHAHVLLTTQRVERRGFGEKDRTWNAQPLLCAWREQWQDACNAALADTGRDERIDHRSNEAQGLPRRPGKPLGPAARMERPNARMRARIEHNREVGVLNEALRLGLGIGLAVERGSLALLAGEVVGETLGRAAAAHLVKPAVAAATRLLHPVTGR